MATEALFAAARQFLEPIMTTHPFALSMEMRDIDPEPMQRALNSLFNKHQAETDQFHALEVMRDDLLSRGDAAVQDVLVQWPEADRQQLRQLIRQHQRETGAGKPPAASRKLFKYLRELQESQGGA